MPATHKTSSSVTSASPVYLQTCSVCKAEFSGRCDWLDHLAQQNHQTLAREECLKIWDSDFRKSCLLIFTSEPLTRCNAPEILDFFCSRPSFSVDCFAMVTDFIWWEARPKIGILMFESREKAKEMLTTSGCRNSQKIRIGDFQWVQAKLGSKLLELECILNKWDAIRQPLEANTNKKLKIHPTANQGTSGNIPHHFIKPMANYEKFIPFPITAISHPLQFQYWTIQNTVLIPEVPITSGPIEKQVCRLLEYICQFDPRCKPLINLATYWLTLNSINISGDGDPDSPTELPAHCTIQWLVMFYFCYKSYTPTPREILTKVLGKDGLTETRNNFPCDPSYVEEWKLQNDNGLHFMDRFSEKFVLNVLQLFGDFLNFFFSTFGGSGVEKVINTHDGKAISVNVLFNPNSSNMSESKRWQNLMSREEIVTLKAAVAKAKSSKKFFGLYMTHPFHFSQKISLAKDIQISLKHFGSGSVKIGLFLQQIKNVGVQTSLSQVGSLKELFTIVNKN